MKIYRLVKTEHENNYMATILGKYEPAVINMTLEHYDSKEKAEKRAAELQEYITSLNIRNLKIRIDEIEVL